MKTRIVYVHPAEAVIEQLIDDYLLRLNPFIPSASEREKLHGVESRSSLLVSQWDEGVKAQESGGRNE